MAESTDGTLTVNSAPSRGRKPHQRKHGRRKRPAVDRTTTTSKCLTMLLVLAFQALTVRRKQSSFNTQNIPILGAGAADAAGAVFRDTAQ